MDFQISRSFQDEEKFYKSKEGYYFSEEQIKLFNEIAMIPYRILKKPFIEDNKNLVARAKDFASAKFNQEQFAKYIPDTEVSRQFRITNLNFLEDFYRENYGWYINLNFTDELSKYAFYPRTGQKIQYFEQDLMEKEEYKEYVRVVEEYYSYVKNTSNPPNPEWFDEISKREYDDIQQRKIRGNTAHAMFMKLFYMYKKKSDRGALSLIKYMTPDESMLNNNVVSIDGKILSGDYEKQLDLLITNNPKLVVEALKPYKKQIDTMLGNELRIGNVSGDIFKDELIQEVLR